MIPSLRRAFNVGFYSGNENQVITKVVEIGEERAEAARMATANKRAVSRIRSP